MTNYSGSISVPATGAVELFAEIGIDPLHCQVTLHAGGDYVTLCNDASGDGVSGALPSESFGDFQFITDKDPVYLTTVDSDAAIPLYYYLSAAA